MLSACGGGGGASTPTPTAKIPAPTPSPAANATPSATSSPASANPSLLKIVYIGGSIAEGAFSSAPEKSYAGLLTSWLATRYPNVEARNLGFGGTGSEFGAYRIDHDLNGFVPDLAFIEFVVNDAGVRRPELTAHIDAIVWKLRRLNPQVKIVYISTTDIGEEADRRAGRRAAFIEDAAFAAGYEELQYIDATTGLWAKVIAGTPISTYITDNVHPNDAGHQPYFEAIRDALAPAIPLTTQAVIPGSKLIAQSKLDTARLEKGSSAIGCRPGTLSLKYMDAGITCNEGDSFTYSFDGTTIGLLKAEVKDGGRLTCSIDGGNPTTADFYSEANRTYERPFPVFLYRQLKPGQHTLACRVTADVISLPTGTSTGHKVTVGYFMVSDERAVTL